MYKVIIIDDNKNDLNMMKNKIINCNKLELECFQDVSKIDMNKNYDAVFIDIDMPMIKEAKRLFLVRKAENVWIFLIQL